MEIDFTKIQQPLSAEIAIDGKTYLYFGGTAYLGIPQSQEFTDLYIEGIKKYGLNNGTSRTNNVQLAIYDEAEQAAAHHFGAEDALITSSGYLAAQLTVNAFQDFGNLVYAPNCHPALWINGKPETVALFTEWKTKTLQQINSSPDKNWVLVSNSMNNLFPEIYDFSFLNNVNPDKSIVLIIDDSHGIGINNNGLTALSALPKRENIICVVAASMAKALGIDAGLVLAPKEVISRLKNTNMFVGASPPAAAGLYAFIHGREIYKSAWKKLQQNMHYLTQHLSSTWKYAAGFPAFLIDDPEIARYLLKQRILISSFPYPTPNGTPINRIVLSSWHSNEHIQVLINNLK